MCLIIASEAGLKPETELIVNASVDNPHGWGIVFPVNGALVVRKGFDVDTLLDLLPAIDSPYVLHFRYATHGRINRANTHPFRVTPDLYFAHNGVLSNVEIRSPKHSDTWNFNRDLLQPVIAGDHTAIRDAELLTELEAFIGAGNKLAFIDIEGKITIANRWRGIEHNGMWLSNSHSLPYKAWKQYATFTPWPKSWEASDTCSTVQPEEFGFEQAFDSGACDYCGIDSVPIGHSATFDGMLCADCAEFFESHLD